MGLFSSIGSAISSVGSAIGDTVGSAAGSIGSAAGSWWDTGIKYGTKAFGWLDDATGWIEGNPITATLLSGVVGGVGSYMSAKDLHKAEEALLEKRLREEREAARIVPARNGGSLGVNTNSITKGAITHGLIASPDDRREASNGLW